MVGRPRAKLSNVVAFEWVRWVFDFVGGEIIVWRLVLVTLGLSCFMAKLMVLFLVIVLRMGLLV